jgi:AcrR family transcriptional regulator
MSAPDDTQNRLLAAAGQVFAEKGFQAATVRDICQRAEANVAAVNYYFRDKEHLYRAALRHAFQCGLEQMPRPQWPAGTPPVTRLRQFIQAVVTHMVKVHSMPWQMQLLLRELSHPSATGAELVRDFIRPVYELLWDILREVMPADVAEDQLHLTAISIIGQCFYHRVAREVLLLVVGEDEFRTYTAPRLAEHIADFSLAALGLGPAVNGGPP